MASRFAKLVKVSRSQFKQTDFYEMAPISILVILEDFCDACDRIEIMKGAKWSKMVVVVVYEDAWIVINGSKNHAQEDSQARCTWREDLFVIQSQQLLDNEVWEWKQHFTVQKKSWNRTRMNLKF